MEHNVVIFVLVVVLVLIVAAIAIHNRLVRLRLTVQESWSDVDTELRRRYDLIPNLVDTVKGYMAHERQIMEAVTQARQALMGPGGSPQQRAEQENELTRALRSLFAIAENYPNLKASDNFKALQEELANTEDRIQAARRFYNANVRANNVAVHVFPSSIIAGMGGFRDAEFFEIEDAAMREPVRVSFP